MKKVYTIGFFAFISVSINVYAQQTANFLWANQVSGISDEQGKAVTVDVNGNVYYTGYFYGTADFDPGIGTFLMTTPFSSGGSGYKQGIFVSKLDAVGNFIWAKQFFGGRGSAGTSITVDANGNVYTTGFFPAALGVFTKCNTRAIPNPKYNFALIATNQTFPIKPKNIRS